MKKQVLSSVITLSLVTLPSIGTAQQSGNEYFSITHKPTGFKLYSCSTENGMPVTAVASSDSSDCSQWQRVNVGEYFHLKNKSSSKFIRPSSAENGASIVVQPNSWTGNWTQWSLVEKGDGYAHLVNRATGKYIFIASGNESGNVEQQPSSWAGDYTRWQFQPVVTAPDSVQNLSAFVESWDGETLVEWDTFSGASEYRVELLLEDRFGVVPMSDQTISDTQVIMGTLTQMGDNIINVTALDDSGNAISAVATTRLAMGSRPSQWDSPQEVTNYQVTRMDNGDYVASWEAPVSATEYRLTYESTSGVSDVITVSDNVNEFPGAVFSEQDGRIEVQAINASGYVSSGAVVSIVQGIPQERDEVAPVEDLTGVVNGDMVDLNWTASPDGVRYILHFFTFEDDGTRVESAPIQLGNVTSTSVAWLNQPMEIRVRAIRDDHVASVFRIITVTGE